MDRYAINAELHRRGTSQQAIARRLGVTKSFVSAVIVGKRGNTPASRPGSTRVKKAVARALGAPYRAVWDANKGDNA